MPARRWAGDGAEAARSRLDTIPGPCPPRPRQRARTTAANLREPVPHPHVRRAAASDAGREARLSGWVNRRRDQGGLIFLDLRDRHGVTQVVIDRTDAPEAHEVASRIRSEFVVTVDGHGREADRRDGEQAPRDRRDRAPGDRACDPQRVEDAAVLRQRPRGPDRRVAAAQVPLPRPAARARSRAGCVLRSRLVHAIHDAHQKAGFVEVETPDLVKATPEGARDFLVPEPAPARQRLRAAAVAPAAEAAADGRGHRPLLPDRALLPRRGPARRPPARVHPARPRDELRRRGGRDGLRRVDDHRGLAGRRARSTDRQRSRSRDSPMPRRWTATARTSPTCDSGWSWRISLPRWSGQRASPPPASASSTRPSRAAAWSRRSCARALRGASRRETDELTESARRYGAGGLAHLAVEDDRHGQRPDRQVPRRGRCGAPGAAGGGEPRRPRADRRGRRQGHERGAREAAIGPGREAQARRLRTSSPTSGSPASRCTSGTPRTSAGTRPTTRSRACCPRTRSCSSPRPATRTDPRRATRPARPARCSTTSS